MTEKVQEKIVAFDTLFTTNQIQTLKILLTYMEPSRQKTIAVYIKFLELQYTISFFKKYPDCTLGYSDIQKGTSITNLCDEILPLRSPSEQEKLMQIKNMMQNLENMQEMMQTMQMMKDMFPDGEIPFDGDVSQLFEMFQNQ